MPSEVFQLFLLLQLKDYASGGLNRVEAQMRGAGKEGRKLLQTFQDMRAEQQRGMSIAAVGVGGLMLLKKGVDEAGEFEDALLSLRSAYQEVEGASSLSSAQQENQLGRLSILATDLGNKLQGSTQNYVGVLAGLRQAGVSPDTVLSGAGRSAAYLANVTGAIREGREKAMAKELGQFGIMYRLRPEEFESSVNLFSALKDRFDIESSSLIESAKYFQATSKQFGMTGKEGAEDTAKFFALLKREGAMEGSIAGTGARSFFMQLTTEQKKLEKLKKETGIELRPFDDKGRFRGYEAIFSEMEKFRKLNQKQSAYWLNTIFGERGQEVAAVMKDAGVQGWRNITAEAKKAVPVNDKINQQMELYTAKIEALEGSWKNLKATAFTPLMNEAKPIVDRMNLIVGSTQEWSAAHPGLTRIAGDLATIGAVTLTVYGGVKMATTGWQLYTIAVRAAGVATQVQTVGVLSPFGMALDRASSKVSSLTTRMRGLGLLSPMGLTVSVLAIGEGLKVMAEWREIREEARRNAEESAKIAEGLGTPIPGGDVLSQIDLTRRLAVERQNLSSVVPGTPEAQPVEAEVARLQNLLQPFQDRQARAAEAAEKAWLGITDLAPTPASPVFGTIGLDYPDVQDVLKFQQPKGSIWQKGIWDAQRAEFINKLRSMPAFQGPGAPYALAELIKKGEAGQLRGVGGWGAFAGRKEESLAMFKGILGEAFPQQYTQAMQLLNQDFTTLSDGTKKLVDQWNSLAVPLEPMPMRFTKAGDAAQQFANRVNAIQFSPTFGQPNTTGTTVTPTPTPTPKASGVSYNLVPQKPVEFRPEVARAIVAESRGVSQSARQQVHHHDNRKVEVHVHASSTEDPEKLARLVAQAVQIEMERA